MKKILVVEDDPNLGMMVQDCLEERDFEVRLAKDGEEGFKAFLDFFPDLCVLDVMMPKQDGFTLAANIRECNQEIPIIFLTAKSMREDVLNGFKIGADDYMKKPFSMEELIVRIQAILTRFEARPAPDRRVYRIGDYVFDHGFQRLKYKEGKDVKLSSREADLLKMLCDNMHQVLDRETALTTLWGEQDFFNSRTMDVYIAKLRKHLQKDSKVEILNIRGKGHKLFFVEQE